ncbi:peroxisome- protein [Rhizopus stolonifer]|uniref:Peroxisome-protein n=1 Tax=Rhizopus stolonifer TaxID=4846 RepID=A0A367KNY6_RHIST|nr:peroxisome- protein [Rhizopus stolonifer]
MVIQCRPSRRYSPDSLSITDSEAESLSKYSAHRHSISMEDTMSTGSNSHRKNSQSRMDMPPMSRKIEEPLKSPTLFSHGLSAYTVLLIPPLLILGLYFKIGIQPHQNASQILLPRFDENTPEYYTNLENMQYAFLFLIRLYDNLVYHVQHITLTTTTYTVLFVVSLFVSWIVLVMGKWLVMSIGLMVLLNKTWVGNWMEVVLQFCMEVVQTMVDLVQTHQPLQKKPIEISVYENQRWWAGIGYTSQLLKSERASWSNITGLEPLPSKEDMPSPAHYVWAEESEWQLDTTGPWTDDALDIVQWIECDEQGWVYSDHRWSHPRGHPDLVSNKPNDAKALTRRRRWFRKADPITQVDIHHATIELESGSNPEHGYTGLSFITCFVFHCTNPSRHAWMPT